MIVKRVKMDDHNLLMVVSSLIAALGIKEIWQILKQKIDINAKKEERQDNLQARVIEELKNKIDGLERKIDELITENTHLRIKIAKMEERLIVTAKKRNQNKYKDEG
jgi:TolA-binding protein